MSLRAPEGLHGRVSAWLVLAVSVAMTLLAWRASLHYQRLDAEQRFAAAADAAVLRIAERMHGYEIVLRAGAGLAHGEELVAVRCDHETVEIHCHGGRAAPRESAPPPASCPGGGPSPCARALRPRRRSGAWA